MQYSDHTLRAGSARKGQDEAGGKTASAGFSLSTTSLLCLQLQYLGHIWFKTRYMMKLKCQRNIFFPTVRPIRPI